MSANAIYLLKPKAERYCEELPSPEEVRLKTASLQELTQLWTVSYETAKKRVQRLGWACAELPRADGLPGVERRPFISYFPKDLQKALKRLRRKKERAAQGLDAHPGGLVVDPTKDRRVKITPEIAELIQAYYGYQRDPKRAPQGILTRIKPGFSWVFEMVTETCPACKAGPMELVHRGANGHYKSARCGEVIRSQESGVGSQESEGPLADARGSDAGCGFAISYASVRRACLRLNPMVATAARDGWNAVANKYLYKGRITRGEYRNHIVVGDHHILDVWAWDERQPFTNAGKPWLHRYWLSAWQDEATGVVAWALGERPNVRLLLAALYRYAMQFGMPVEIRTDNGKDYLSQEFIKFWQASGIEFQHKSLPSCRTGESHGKSKVIERWFGTFERGVMRLLPGWCGTHPKERPDDVLWPQVQEHKKYLAARYLNGPGMGGERPVHSPFLTREELDEKIAQWVSGKYHARATKRLDMTPLEAYQRDAHAVNRLTKEALLILMMRPRDRHILSNGVSIYGQHYWHSDFANLKGLACDVRIDPDDLSQVIVLINDGKKERALVAECSLPSGSSEDDLAEVKRRQKADRGVVRDYFEMQQRRLAGRRTWDEVLAEKAAKAAPLAEAVGAGPVVLPMTEGHRIAKALGQAGVRSQSPSGWGSPESRTPSPESRPLKLMPDLDAPPAHPSKPVFTTAWEKEQWEKEHPEDEQ